MILSSIRRPKLYQAINELQTRKYLIQLTRMTNSKVVCHVNVQN